MMDGKLFTFISLILAILIEVYYTKFQGIHYHMQIKWLSQERENKD